MVRSMIAASVSLLALAATAAGAQDAVQSSQLPPAEPSYAPGGPPPPAQGYGEMPPGQPYPDAGGATQGPPPDTGAYRRDYGPPPPPPQQGPPPGAYGPPGPPPDQGRYDAPPPPDPRMAAEPSYPATTPEQAYSRAEIVNSISDFLGVPAEAAGSAVEHVFHDNGYPTAYIAGEEGAAAFAVGVRYGKGLLYMKGRPPIQVYWQGPSVGFDVGGNASRVFTLVYNLHYPDMIYRRFPGVEGSAYFIGGLGVNYQRAEGVTLAPMRAGVGLRLGANVGYLSYSRHPHILPF